MKISIKEHCINIDVWELLSELSDDDLVELADTLSCQEAVIKNVADQIIHGCTDAGSSGYTGQAEYEPTTALEAARCYVADHASYMASHERWRLGYLLRMARDAERQEQEKKTQVEVHYNELLGKLWEFERVIKDQHEELQRLRTALKEGAGAKSELIQVCDNCLQASCWQGIFMCDKATQAGTVYKTRSELQRMNRENPCYWKTDEELARGERLKEGAGA